MNWQAPSPSTTRSAIGAVNDSSGRITRFLVFITIPSGAGSHGQSTRAAGQHGFPTASAQGCRICLKTESCGVTGGGVAPAGDKTPHAPPSLHHAATRSRRGWNGQPPEPPREAGGARPRNGVWDGGRALGGTRGPAAKSVPAVAISAAFGYGPSTGAVRIGRIRVNRQRKAAAGSPAPSSRNQRFRSAPSIMTKRVQHMALQRRSLSSGSSRRTMGADNDSSERNASVFEFTHTNP